jgi:hypothetical protein
MTALQLGLADKRANAIAKHAATRFFINHSLNTWTQDAEMRQAARTTRRLACAQRIPPEKETEAAPTIAATAAFALEM